MLLSDRFSWHWRLVFVSEGNCEIWQERLQSATLRRQPESPGLGCLVVWRLVEGVLLWAQHPFDGVVVGVEIVAGHGPVLVAAVRDVFLDEPLFVLADQHVRVDERAAAEPAGDERVHPAEAPEVVQPVQSLAGIPEVPSHAVRAAGKRTWRIRFPPLQKADS